MNVAMQQAGLPAQFSPAQPSQAFIQAPVVVEAGLPDIHPRLRRVMDHWLAARTEGAGLPSRATIDPGAVRADLPYVWLLDVQQAPFRLRYRLVGTKIAEAAKRALTGLWLDEAHADGGAEWAVARARRAAAERRPDWSRGPQSLFPQTALRHGIETLMLPLAADGRNVDMLLCCSAFHRNDGKAV